MDEKVQKVLDYIEEHKEEYLELLLRFCRQPSVAATGEGIEKMAGMVVDELKKLGVEPTVLETGGSPLFTARSRAKWTARSVSMTITTCSR